MIRYISASHNESVLYKNLMRSSIANIHGVYVYDECKNVAKAYNWLNDRFEINLFVHHDVFLPKDFEENIDKALREAPDNFGVLGVAGVKLVNGKKQNIGYIKDRGNIWGSPNGLPAEVDTLDEMLLITHGDFTFDEKLPLDFYGADICMQAKQQGRKCYAINAFCHHNSTRKIGERTKSFYESEKYFKEKWKKYLPIATTCSMLS